MPGKYEIFKDAFGQFRFHLKAGNGQIIASSEAYMSRDGAEAGIQSVKDNASSDTVDLT